MAPMIRAAGSAEEPFYRNLQSLMDKVPGGHFVEKLVRCRGLRPERER